MATIITYPDIEQGFTQEYDTLTIIAPQGTTQIKFELLSMPGPGPAIYEAVYEMPAGDGITAVTGLMEVMNAYIEEAYPSDKTSYTVEMRIKITAGSTVYTKDIYPFYCNVRRSDISRRRGWEDNHYLTAATSRIIDYTTMLHLRYYTTADERQNGVQKTVSIATDRGTVTHTETDQTAPLSSAVWVSYQTLMTIAQAEDPLVTEVYYCTYRTGQRQQTIYIAEHAYRQKYTYVNEFGVTDKLMVGGTEVVREETEGEISAGYEKSIYDRRFATKYKFETGALSQQEGMLLLSMLHAGTMYRGDTDGTKMVITKADYEKSTQPGSIHTATFEYEPSISQYHIAASAETRIFTSQYSDAFS